MRKLVEIGENTSRKIISKKIDDLHKIAKGLLEYETLSAEDISNILSGKEVNRASSNAENTSIDPEINKPIKNQDIKNPRPNET